MLVALIHPAWTSCHSKFDDLFDVIVLLTSTPALAPLRPRDFETLITLFVSISISASIRVFGCVWFLQNPISFRGDPKRVMEDLSASNGLQRLLFQQMHHHGWRVGLCACELSSIVKARRKTLFA